MQPILETERLILRHLEISDVDAMYELDSDPLVHKYLGNNPATSKERIVDVINSLKQQYAENGIGRWAAIEKLTGNFIGWSGLKFIKEPENNHVNFYDVGYRLIPKYWRKGYATESAKAAIEYGFTHLNAPEIIGTANIENKASRKALEKCGLTYIESFMWNDIPCDWLKITKEQWRSNQENI